MMESLAALFHSADRELELQRIALPKLRDAEILVRVLGCTLCGSDLHTFDGRRETPAPTILGHEIVGEIATVGNAAPRYDLAGQELRVGDRITWSIVASCGECFFCLRDLPQKCLVSVKYGHEKIEPGYELRGGLAEYCLLAPGTAIVRLPDDLPLTVACPANCATATVAAALAAAGELPGRNVCLFGAGLLGLTATAMLKVGGAACIVCVDVDESRRERAFDFGATHAVSPDELPKLANDVTKQHGFDILLELSGSAAAFESGLQVIRKGGTFVLVGAVFPTAPVAVVPEQIVRNNLTIHGVHNYAPPDLLQAVEFLSKHHGDFPFAELVSDWLPLESVGDAFELSHDPGRIRVGVGLGK